MSRLEPSALSRRQALAYGGACAALALTRFVPEADAAQATMVEIAPGVLVHRGRHALFDPENAGDISNVTAIIGNDAVAIIDTGGSAKVGASIREAVRQATTKPIRYVINTHMHPDHVFGNAAFEAHGVEFVGHAKLARALAARAERYLAINKELLGAEAFEGTRIIPPSRLVDGTLELDLGGRRLHLEAQRTAHTDNDLTVRDETTGTLVLGDLLFSEHVPTLDGSIRGWLALMDTLSASPAQRVVPGHGPASMTWPDAIGPQKRYFSAIATDVRKLIKDGKSISDATASAAMSEKDQWALFGEFHARNVSAAFAELEWE